MIKAGIAEIAGIIVTVAASASVVALRRIVASGTILPANGVVIEEGVAEIAGVAVASRTSARIMTLRRGVAGGAVLAADAGMVEGGVAEAAGVAVAVAAGAFVMVGRWVMAGGAVVVANEAVVEVDVLPGADFVAEGAVTAVHPVVFVILRMAGDTAAVGGLVVAAGVAGFALDVIVPALKREETVVDVAL